MWNKTLTVVAGTMVLGACGGSGSESTDPSEPDASETDGVDSGAQTTPDERSEELVGCRNPANWECNPPSPGFEFGCVAVCDNRVSMTCNQDYRGGVCSVNGVECDAPTAVSGCAICRTAVLTTCAGVISE